MKLIKIDFITRILILHILLSNFVRVQNTKDGHLYRALFFHGFPQLQLFFFQKEDPIIISSECLFIKNI